LEFFPSGIPSFVNEKFISYLESCLS
jgi:hypothetical protein